MAASSAIVPLTLASFLPRECIAGNLTAADKPEVLAELAACLVQHHEELVLPEVVTILEAREALSSTGLEHGVAIPHGKWPGLSRVIACFRRSRAGIDFAALDRKPTQLFFLLLAPVESTSHHLRALARVARLMKDTDLRGALLAADDDNALYRLLIEADGRL